MVRPKKLGKNFVPQPWISESESEDDLESFNLLNHAAKLTRKRKVTRAPCPVTVPPPEPDPEPPDDADPGSDLNDISSEEEEDQEENYSYLDFLDTLSKQWMTVELNHTVSKAASDAYWKIALSSFHKLWEKRKGENIIQKNPQFTHLRRVLRTQYIPDIEMKVGFRNKETNEEIHINSNVIPVSKYPRSEYTQLYEIATIKVITLICILSTCKS